MPRPRHTADDTARLLRAALAHLTDANDERVSAHLRADSADRARDALATLGDVVRKSAPLPVVRPATVRDGGYRVIGGAL